jgi:hypothetical protein
MGPMLFPCLQKPGRRWTGLVFFCFVAASLTAQTGEAAPGRGDYLTLKIAVMGPGDELYFWWGHIALVIEDRASGESRFYDYGLFSFDTENFYRNFAMGRLLYRCGVSRTDLNYGAYTRTNRDITVYTLDLPAAKKEDIRAFVEWNTRPENRNYYYHHFRDNCATRIRDIIDLAVDGQFKAALGEAPGRYTLRQHVRRHTWFSPFFDWLLNFLMGQDIDTPITVWEEMFLPQEIGSRIEQFTYRDPSGRERKLTASREALNRAVNRPPVLEAPRQQWPRELALGAAVAAALALLCLGRKKWPPSARVLGISQSLLGLFFGAAGLVLFFMTFFTNHDYTFHNSNIIYVNPLLLAALPLGLWAAFSRERLKRRRAEKLLRGLWALVFFGGLLTMALKLLPWFYQQNQVTQALILPIALVLCLSPGRRWEAP